MCQRATLGCAGRGHSVPWATRADAGAATAGVALGSPSPLWGVAAALQGGPWPVELWGPRTVCLDPPSTRRSPTLWDTPVPQGPRGSARLGAGGKGCGAGRRGGAAIISAVTHVLITENGLISLRLEAA